MSEHAVRDHRIAGAVSAAPPHVYFLVSAVFHYLGPSFAVLLFARVDVLGVAWLRVVSAAAIFAAWRRPCVPRRRPRGRPGGRCSGGGLCSPS